MRSPHNKEFDGIFRMIDGLERQIKAALPEITEEISFIIESEERSEPKIEKVWTFCLTSDSWASESRSLCD